MRLNIKKIRDNAHKRNKEFYKYLTAMNISRFGAFLTYFSVALIVYSIYRSGIMLSIFELVSVVPVILLSVPIGMWLTNRDLKKVWYLSSIIIGTFNIVVFMNLNIYFLFALNLITTVFSICIGISSQSILPEIVGKEELPWANSVIMFSVSAMGMISPAVSGFILSYSWNLPFLIDSLTYFVEAVIVFMLSVNITAKNIEKREKPRISFREYFGYLRRNKLLRNILIIVTFLMFVAGGLKILHIAYFSGYEKPYTYYGLAMSVSAVGFFLILLFTTLKILVIKKPYKVCILSLPLYVMFFAAIYISNSASFAIVCFLLLGLGNGLLSPNFTATIQKYTEKSYLTSILGIYQTLINGGRIASISITGFLVTIFQPRILYLFIGIAFGIVFLIFLPSIRYER